MLRGLRPLLTALAAVIALAQAGAMTASADGGACGAVPGRPVCTILRPVAVPASRQPALTSQECVVIVGGLASPTDGTDAPFFTSVLGDIGADPHFRLVRFGVDGGAYDTTGAISRNAEELRSLIHGLGAECQATHVLAHSMGGAVADRALSKGDPAAEGVVTYVALASPHNGSLGARAVRVGVELDDTFAAAAHELASRTGLHDPTSDAVRDLAPRKRPRPPHDVATVRERMVTDLTVLRQDNVDRRYDVREYRVGSFAELEGHSGIVHNRHARQVVEHTIRTHGVPPEERSAREVKAASLGSRLVDRYWAGVVGAAGLALADVAVGAAVGATARDALAELTAGDAGGAAAAVSEHAGTLVSRAVERIPREAELVTAASGLRGPLPLTLLKLLLETALE